MSSCHGIHFDFHSVLDFLHHHGRQLNDDDDLFDFCQLHQKAEDHSQHKRCSHVLPGTHLSTKRHSLANITEVFRQQSSVGTGRRGSTIDTFKGIPGHGLESGIKNQDLERVQAAVVSLFQRKKLQENELGTLQQCVRRLMKSEAGPLICDYYKDKLLKKGMVILRETIKHDIGRILLQKVADQWNYFFKTVLPYLLAIFYPLKVEMPLRAITLTTFRDIVIYKVAFDESISVPNIQIPPAIIQMLLILQSVREPHPTKENTMKIELMVAKVVSPYLGSRGLYLGGNEPVVRRESRCTSSFSSLKPDCEQDKLSVHQEGKHYFGRHSGGLIMHSTLEPVAEIMDLTKKMSDVS